MAIFYDYIKGTEGTTITKINFLKNARPTIEVGSTNYGSIITSDGTVDEIQNINTNLIITQNLTVIGNLINGVAATESSEASNIQSSIMGNLTVSNEITAEKLTLNDNTTIILGTNNNALNTFQCNKVQASSLQIGSDTDGLSITPTEFSSQSDLTLKVSEIIFK